jgi:hypothetical protein|tara:strand:+ start:1330 stop:1989 length:660 start_codon:yes stop_codon:yes gene_type:complete
MTKVHFMTPCYGGQITEVCFNSYLQWSIIATKNNIDFQIDTLSNESNVNRARNTCASKFLSGDATHLMFVDADIKFNPTDVVKLLTHDKDIVGGIYPQKTLPPKMVVNTIDNGKREGNLIEVGTIGTGFMLIKRTVFEKLIEEGATPYNDQMELINNNQYDFFQCTIDSRGRYLTEDWSFCRRWRQVGGEVWADLDIALEHVGYFRFQPDMKALSIGNS